METKFLELTSVSCPGSGKMQDCGILVLLQYIGNYRLDVTYDDIVQFISKRLESVGIKYSDKEQLGKDMFEATLMHFLPQYQVDLFNVIRKPGQKTDVELYTLNKEAPKKSEYRLALLSSWDRSRNSVGAGHFVILNTNWAKPEDIIRALAAREYKETRFLMKSCLVCGEVERGVCATCKEASYCSREHQNVHWIEGGHRYVCYDHREDPLMELRLDLEEPHPLVAQSLDAVQRRLGEQILRQNDSERAREWLRYNHIEQIDGIFGDLKKSVKKGWQDFKNRRAKKKNKGKTKNWFKGAKDEDEEDE